MFVMGWHGMQYSQGRFQLLLLSHGSTGFLYGLISVSNSRKDLFSAFDGLAYLKGIVV